MPDFGKLLSLAGNIAIYIATGFYVIYLAKRKLNEMIANRQEPISGNFIKGQSKVDVLINKKMEEAKEALNADAVLVFEFHNGGHWSNGRRALKASCTYEVVRYGIKSVSGELRDIPLSMAPVFINRLLTENNIKIKNLDQVDLEMISTTTLLMRYNVYNAYAQVICNKEKDPVGFVIVVSGKNNHMKLDTKVVDRLCWFIEENLINSVNK